MTNILSFNKIQNEGIFSNDFLDMRERNKLEFSNGGAGKIAIIYGPNGTGKTSLTKTLASDTNSSFILNYNGDTYTQEDCNLFHIIEDQNGRNIIKGTTTDFLLGDNITKEFSLKSCLDKEFDNLFKKTIKDELKKLNITKKTSKLSDLISNEFLKICSKDIANNQSNGNQIDRNEFIEAISTLSEISLEKYDVNKFEYIKKDYEDPRSIIIQIMNAKDVAITKNINVRKIEEHNVAIDILNKYSYKKECIVCDHVIDPLSLLEHKKVFKASIIETLDEESKRLFNKLKLRSCKTAYEP